MIDISEKAKEHMIGISNANNGKVVFLGIKGGGCAGFSYDWTLKEESELDDYSDEIIELDEEHKLAIDGTSLMYLYGSQINLKQNVKLTLGGCILQKSSNNLLIKKEL